MECPDEGGVWTQTIKLTRREVERNARLAILREVREMVEKHKGFPARKYGALIIGDDIDALIKREERER